MLNKIRHLAILLAFFATSYTLQAQCNRTLSASQTGVCAGSTITYSVSNPTATSTYYWYIGGPATGTIIGQGSSSIQIQWDSFTGYTIGSSTVECTVTDPVNCQFGVNVNYYTESIHPIHPTTNSIGPNTGTVGATSVYTNTKSYGVAWGGYHSVTGGTILSQTSDLGWPTETITAVVQWTTPGTGEICWHEGYFNPYCEGLSCFNVYVSPSSAINTTISGPSSPCQNSIATYSVPTATGNTYSWSVTGGSIQSGGTSNQINVLWSSSGPGLVTVVVTNNGFSGSGQKSVSMAAAPVAAATAASPTVYDGYAPAACTDLTASGTGGNGNYTYSWSNNSTSSTINVCPTATTTYTVTVTDQSGCADVASVQVVVENVTCPGNKIRLCHENGVGVFVTKCVKYRRVSSHLAHGDYLGTCTNKTGAEPDIDLESEFVAELFPNPFTESTTIRLRPAEDEALTVEVFDMQGRSIVSLYDGIAEQDSEINLKYTPPAAGFYFCRIIGSQSGTHVLKLIAQ